jgi:hypothetical protein
LRCLDEPSKTINASPKRKTLAAISHGCLFSITLGYYLLQQYRVFKRASCIRPRKFLRYRGSYGPADAGKVIVTVLEAVK